MCLQTDSKLGEPHLHNQFCNLNYSEDNQEVHEISVRNDTTKNVKVKVHILKHHFRP